MIKSKVQEIKVNTMMREGSKNNLISWLFSDAQYQFIYILNNICYVYFIYLINDFNKNATNWRNRLWSFIISKDLNLVIKLKCITVNHMIKQLKLSGLWIGPSIVLLNFKFFANPSFVNSIPTFISLLTMMFENIIGSDWSPKSERIKSPID